MYLRIKEKINLIYNTLTIPFPTNSNVIDYIEKKPYLYEIIKMTKVEEIIDSEGLKNVVNDQYKENDHSDTTKGTHIDLAKSITINTSSATQNAPIAIISPYFSYIKKASKVYTTIELNEFIENSKKEWFCENPFAMNVPIIYNEQ